MRAKVASLDEVRRALVALGASRPNVHSMVEVRRALHEVARTKGLDVRTNVKSWDEARRAIVALQ